MIMPTTPTESINERLLKLVDELDVARSAFDAAIAGRNDKEAANCLRRIREIAGTIDTLKYGAGDTAIVRSKRSTKA